MIGTPPNAIAAGVANIGTKDIAMAGIGSSLISLLTIWLAFPTWGLIVYPELSEFPSWAEHHRIGATSSPDNGILQQLFNATNGTLH